MVLSTANVYSQDLKSFISHVNGNVAQYAFFYQTTIQQNALDNYVIKAPNNKIFNEHLKDRHLVPFLT